MQETVRQAADGHRRKTEVSRIALPSRMIESGEIAKMFFLSETTREKDSSCRLAKLEHFRFCVTCHVSFFVCECVRFGLCLYISYLTAVALLSTFLFRSILELAIEVQFYAV